jgi:hypothetical protein
MRLNQDISHLPREILEERYNHHEKYRQQKLKKCREERSLLINEHYRKTMFIKNHFKVFNGNFRKILSIFLTLI